MGKSINASKAEQRQSSVPPVRVEEEQDPIAPPEAHLIACLGILFEREHDALEAIHTCECRCGYCWDLAGVSYYVDMIAQFVPDKYRVESYEKWPLVDQLQAWMEEKLGSSLVPGGIIRQVKVDGMTLTEKEDPPAAVKCCLIMKAIYSALDRSDEHDAWHWQWMLTYGISAIEGEISQSSLIEELAGILDDAFEPTGGTGRYEPKLAFTEADEPLTVLA